MTRRFRHDLSHWTDAQLQHVWDNPTRTKRAPHHPTLKYLRLSDAVLAEQQKRASRIVCERLAPIWTDLAAVRALFCETGATEAYDRLIALEAEAKAAAQPASTARPFTPADFAPEPAAGTLAAYYYPATAAQKRKGQRGVFYLQKISAVGTRYGISSSPCSSVREAREFAKASEATPWNF